jgi:hypothetical protein
MPYKDYDRYALLKNGDGTIDPMPLVKIPVSASDKYEYWNENFSRLDKISLKYYGSPFYDFILMAANGQYLTEFDFPNQMLLRIPFPLNFAKAAFEAAITAFKKK